jgi:hypothetical protein
MDRNNGLADLTLVNKYFPVANYSYPRPESCAQHEPRTIADRNSLGSEGSAPGLVDDRSDSEASFGFSFDEERNYEVKAAELWDSFWEPQKEHDTGVEVISRNQYPIYAQQPRPTSPTSTGRGDRTHRPSNRTAWPLSENATQRSGNRKSAANYSPFPKPTPLPTRANPISPSWQSSRPRQEHRKQTTRSEKPLKHSIRESLHIPGFLFPSLASSPQPEPVERMSKVHPTVTQRPSTSSGAATQRPKSFFVSPPSSRAEVPRPTTSHDVRRSSQAECLTQLAPSPSSLFVPFRTAPKPPTHTFMHRPPTPHQRTRASVECYHVEDTTMPILPDSCGHTRRPDHRGTSPTPTLWPVNMATSTPVPGMEPQSVFEDDSEDENDEDKGKRFFSRLHKRSVSDLRRWRRSGEAVTRTRTRTNTVPSTPAESKRPQGVFHRMLGRRNS